MVASLMKKIISIFMFFCSLSANASRVGDLVELDGVRDNQLLGYGLVVGLDGTGDKSAFTQSTLKTYLINNGIKLPPGVSVKSKNVAAVTVTSNLPSFASVGRKLDVTVSSIGDAKSLRGGTLVLTPLKGVDGKVYALSQGSLLVGGLDESGADGSKISINISSVGRIPSGATVEVPFEGQLVSGGYLMLNLKNPSFAASGRIKNAVNSLFGYELAFAENHAQVFVKAPDSKNELVDFIESVQNVWIDDPKVKAKVTVNSRTGTVIITETVSISPVAITHGGITLQVSESPDLEMFTGDIEQDSTITISEKSQRIFGFSKGANLNDIISSFNEMGLAPSDLVAILEALKSSGSLRADLEII
jgi:flagellar P-ring protein precursor FlgI